MTPAIRAFVLDPRFARYICRDISRAAEARSVPLSAAGRSFRRRS